MENLLIRIDVQIKIIDVLAKWVGQFMINII
jgi:hypothetical protein